MMKVIIAGSIAAALSSAAGAQTVSIMSSNPAPKFSKDPNRKICETVEKTGSRLGAVRTCMTAQQWYDQRHEHRNDTERAQKNIGIKSPLTNG